MKIIHTADLHLASKMESHLSNEKAKEMRNELKQNFYKLVTFAQENNIELILIVGDLFDKTNIVPNIKNFVLDTIKQFSNIKFAFVAGNHDSSVFDDVDLPDNLFMFSKNWTYYNFGNITLAGVEISEFNNDNLLDSLSLNEDETNIVLLHGEITTNSNNVSYGINLNKLKNKNINYLALGHIHKFSKGKLNDNCEYCYPGILEGTGFDELGTKGFVLLDTDVQKISPKFIPFTTRTWEEIFVNIEKCNSEIDILNEINRTSKHINENCLVKINLTGEIALDFSIDFSYLSSVMNEKFYFARIINSTKPKLDLSALEGDISLKGEFIKLVLASDEIDEKEKQNVIYYGIKALEGDEI